MTSRRMRRSTTVATTLAMAGGKGRGGEEVHSQYNCPVTSDERNTLLVQPVKMAAFAGGVNFAGLVKEPKRAAVPTSRPI